MSFFGRTWQMIWTLCDSNFRPVNSNVVITQSETHNQSLPMPRIFVVWHLNSTLRSQHATLRLQELCTLNSVQAICTSCARNFLFFFLHIQLQLQFLFSLTISGVAVYSSFCVRKLYLAMNMRRKEMKEKHKNMTTGCTLRTLSLQKQVRTLPCMACFCPDSSLTRAQKASSSFM